MILTSTRTSLMILFLLLCLAPTRAADSKAPGAPVKKETLLVDLEPADSGWGTERHPALPDLSSGPSVCDFGPWSHVSGAFWPDNKKIVKKIDPAFRLGEGKAYESKMTDVFAVGGEFVTGVGLWSKRMLFYHWLDYRIPAGAKSFQATVLATDDAAGYVYGPGPKNQEFSFIIEIDGREAFGKSVQRLGKVPGAGDELCVVSLELPKDAKTIRFKLLNSGWGDANNNTELVITKGTFN